MLLNAFQKLNAVERILALGLLWVGVGYFINFGVLGFLVSDYDYDHLSAYYEIAGRFWRQGGGLPEFNPYLCGGRSLGADPQIPIFHPFVFLVPIIGPTLVVKWEMLFQLFLGGVGLIKWLRLLKVSREAQWFGLFTFLTFGGIVARFRVGHVTLGYVFLSPLLFYLNYRFAEAGKWGTEKWNRFGAYVLLFAYAALYKPNFLIYFVPLLFAEHFSRAVLTRNWRVIFFPVAAISLAVGIDAIVYMPSYRFFQDFPRPNEMLQMHYRAISILPNLLLPYKTLPRAWLDGSFFGTHEYNIYVGPVAIGLALFGFWRKARKRFYANKISLGILALVSFLIGIGAPPSTGAGWFPYSWLAIFWPGFTTARVPSRFWVGVGLAIIPLSALGWDQLPKRVQGLKLGLIIIAVIPATLSTLIHLTQTSLRVHQSQWSGRAQILNEPQWAFNDADHSFATIRSGESALNCMNNMQVMQSPALEALPLLHTGGTFSSPVRAQWRGWSRFTVKTEATQGIAIFNITHSPYWRIAGTGEITSQMGERLAISAKNGIDAELTFHQPGIKLGAAISLVSLILFALVYCAGRFSIRMRSTGSGISKRKTLA